MTHHYHHVVAQVCAALMLSTLPLWGQQSLEIGGFIGASNYSGELHLVHYEVADSRLAAGFIARYHLNPAIAFRTHFLRGRLQASDAAYPTIEQRRQRNLSFRTTIFDLALMAEVNLAWFGQGARLSTSPYLVLGISGFYFNPQALYNGLWIDLQPLGTEGQGYPGLSEHKRYSRLQLSIPMGIGYTWRINNYYTIGFQVVAHKTFTDYLDDVSGQYPDLTQLKKMNPLAAALSYRSPDPSAPLPPERMRGNPNTKDWYFFTGIIFTRYLQYWNEKDSAKNRGITGKKEFRYF